METEIDSITQKRLQNERALLRLQLLLSVCIILVGTGGLILRIVCGAWRRPIDWLLIAIFSIASLFALLRLGPTLFHLLPGHSFFAASVLRQAEEGETLQELYAQIDCSLREMRRDFGSLAVGRDWVVGEQVVRLCRVCGIFLVAGLNGVYTLCLAELSGDVCAVLQDLGDNTEAAAAYLCQLLPRAACGGGEDYRAFLALPLARWKKYAPALLDPWSPDKLVFWGADGMPTSHFDCQSVLVALREAKEGEEIGFTLLEPYPRTADEVTGLSAWRKASGQWTLCAALEADGAARRVTHPVGAEEARDALLALLEHGALPETAAWTRENNDQKNSYELHVDDDTYLHNSLEDVYAALDGVADGRYGTFSLMRPDRSTGGLFVDRIPDGFRVMAAVPGDDGIRWKETVTTRLDQLRFWLNGYYMQSTFPYLAGWDDVTKLMDREE